MSLQTSRYESQNVVNAFNIFVDTGKANIIGDGQSTGDNYLVHLASGDPSARHAVSCTLGPRVGARRGKAPRA